MVVAAGAAERHAQPGGRGRFDAIDNVFVLVLLRNRAAFEVDHVIAIEAGGDDLRLRGMRQQVAGNLFDRELVVRHVAD